MSRIEIPDWTGVDQGCEFIEEFVAPDVAVRAGRQVAHLATCRGQQLPDCVGGGVKDHWGPGGDIVDLDLRAPSLSGEGAMEHCPDWKLVVRAAQNYCGGSLFPELYGSIAPAGVTVDAHADTQPSLIVPLAGRARLLGVDADDNNLLGRPYGPGNAWFVPGAVFHGGETMGEDRLTVVFVPGWYSWPRITLDI